MSFAHLLFFNLLVTALLTGLIWLVQLVHYPGFALVAAPACNAYQQAHTRRISYLVIPLMLAELALSAWLLWQTAISSPPQPILLYGLAGVCVLLVWLITFLVFVPLHRRLETEGYSPQLVQQLCHWNWPRTLLWSLRCLLLSYLLLGLL
jgi:hypothetical protein